MVAQKNGKNDVTAISNASTFHTAMRVARSRVRHNIGEFLSLHLIGQYRSRDPFPGCAPHEEGNILRHTLLLLKTFVLIYTLHETVEISCKSDPKRQAICASANYCTESQMIESSCWTQVSSDQKSNHIKSNPSSDALGYM